jgi:hypothetical protein
VVCFGIDGVAMFIGMHTCGVSQLRFKSTPFMTMVHCMAHQTNLTMKILFTLSLVSKLEGFCILPIIIFHLEQKGILSNVFLPCC